MVDNSGTAVEPFSQDRLRYGIGEASPLLRGAMKKLVGLVNPIR